MNPATVDRLVATRGVVHVGRADALVAARGGDPLRAGTLLRTGSAGFALFSIGSVTMRVGPWTQLELTRPGHLRLERGRVYVDDAMSRRPDESLVIDTPLGRVTDSGARFQMRLDPMALSVGVRDGSVLVGRGTSSRHALARGQGVDVFKNGAVRRVAVAPCGTPWAWTNALMPEAPTHGRPLAAFLEWFTRETGYVIVLLDQVTQDELDRTPLYGNIRGLSPDAALAVVTHLTQFDFATHPSGELKIERRELLETGT